MSDKQKLGFISVIIDFVLVFVCYTLFYDEVTMELLRKVMIITFVIWSTKDIGGSSKTRTFTQEMSFLYIRQSVVLTISLLAYLYSLWAK